MINTYPKHDYLEWANDRTHCSRVRFKSAFMGDINGDIGTGEESVNGIIVGWRKLLENEGMMSRNLG